MWCLFPWAFAFCHTPGPPRAGFWYARRVRYSATSTAIAIVPPGELLLAPGQRAPTEFSTLVVDRSLVAGLLGGDVLAPDGVPSLPAAPPVVDDATLAAAFGELVDALLAGVRDRSRTNELLRAFVVRAFARPRSTGAVTPLPLDRPVRQTLKFVDEHYGERIGLDEIAGAAGVSKFHLARVFHAKVGLPVYQYLKKVRLAHALELLRAGVRAADVVSAVGFADQPHMTRVFHHELGLTPRRYARGSVADASVPAGDPRSHHARAHAQSEAPTVELKGPLPGPASERPKEGDRRRRPESSG
jgi:AraC-like DNA-binding protein